MCFVKKQKSVESKIKRKFRGYFHKFSFPKKLGENGLYMKTMSISDFVFFKNGFEEDEASFILDKIKKYQIQNKKEVIIVDTLLQQFEEYVRITVTQKKPNSGECYIMRSDLNFLCNRILNGYLRK